MEAVGVIGQTQASFQHSSSNMGDAVRAGGDEPHTTMDTIDQLFGIEGSIGGG